MSCEFESRVLQGECDNKLGPISFCTLYGQTTVVAVCHDLKAEREAECRAATGWFRSGEEVDQMAQLRVDLTYGPLDSTFPDELQPEDGFVSIDSVEFILPTHLSFLATSSFEGAEFAGAVGSTLIIHHMSQ